MLKSYLLVFFVSMVPLIELRGAIPRLAWPARPIWAVHACLPQIPISFVRMATLCSKAICWYFVSMVPLIELRGAIPIGLGMGLPILPTYLVCVVGNMIPVPFIYLFARKFLIWGYHKPLIGPICKFCIVKGEKGGRALEAKAGRGLVVALLLFVGIPLPGTGAWTGTLAGSILDMKFKDVVKACMGGVLLAGIIMGLASAGLLGALSTLFSVG